jgi:hypothetical protein
MLTLVKFIDNYDAESRNRIITRTMGKLGVIDSSALSQMPTKPKSREFWYCNIVKETGAGTPTGVFTLAPVEKLPSLVQDGYESVNVVHLIPGMYDSMKSGNVMLLHPKTKGPHWIVSNVLRQHLMGRNKDVYAINSVIVVFDGAKDWPKLS